MTHRTFYIADVFASEKYSGNQLAVVTDSDGLSTPQMLQITREMHFSETTFICSDQQANGGFDVRIFTPGEEVPFAGHPTLGTAFVLIHVLGKVTSGKVLLNLGVGQIPVTQQGDLWWMTTNAPKFSQVFAPEDLAAVLTNLDGGDVLFIDEVHRLPRQVEESGLERDQIDVADEAIRDVIASYTREAGVRNLERELGAPNRLVGHRVGSERLRLGIRHRHARPYPLRRDHHHERYELDHVDRELGRIRIELAVEDDVALRLAVELADGHSYSSGLYDFPRFNIPGHDYAGYGRSDHQFV